MASSQDRTKKNKKFPILVVEDSLFLASILRSNSTDVIAKRIYSIIKNDAEVPEDLKIIYRERLFGKNANVKR